MKTILIILALFLIPSIGWAKTFSWTPPTTYVDGSSLPANEIDSYNAYCGASSGVYTIATPMGNVVSYVIDGDLPKNNKITTYYCVVTTIATNQKESAYSNEVTFPFDSRVAASPINDLAVD